MPVIVNSGSARTVVIDRARVATIAEKRPEVREVSDQRTTEAVARQTNIVSVGSPGPQGVPGPTGSSAYVRLAGPGGIGGHRLVRSIGSGAVGYVSASNVDHGDDTEGLSLNAAAEGADVTIQTAGPVAFAGWAWTPQQPVFAGDDGLLTQTPPTTGFVQIVGHAEDATTLFLRIESPVYH